MADQPLENKGCDEGMTPPELFLASLGSCAAFYADDSLKRNNLLQEGCRVRVSADKAKVPARLTTSRSKLRFLKALMQNT